jgi:hypothetical protein
VDPLAVRAALANHLFAERVDRDVRSGEANVVSVTPSIFIDGEYYFRARDVQSLRRFLATKIGRGAGSVAR